MSQKSKIEETWDSQNILLFLTSIYRMKQHIENQLLAVSPCSVSTPVEIQSTCSILLVKQIWNLVLSHSLAEKNCDSSHDYRLKSKACVFHFHFSKSITRNTLHVHPYLPWTDFSALNILLPSTCWNPSIPPAKWPSTVEKARPWNPDPDPLNFLL